METTTQHKILALQMYIGISQLLQASRTPKKLQPIKRECLDFLQFMAKKIAAEINTENNLQIEVADVK